MEVCPQCEEAGDFSEDSLYDTNLEYRVAIDQMIDTDFLSKTHRHPAGYKCDELFEKIDMKKINKIVNSVTEVFEKDLSLFFMEENITMQPDYKRWRNCIKKARQELLVEREHMEEKKIIKKRNTLMAINEHLKTGSANASLSNDRRIRNRTGKRK